ncbi:MAG: aminomethyl-transferring glycine dehydrogenase [Phycisphaerales bacterium]|nr:aminomethyl-transferring glycine dehydrogenase [Phycisphaerales bacterium]
MTTTNSQAAQGGNGSVGRPEAPQARSLAGSPFAPTDMFFHRHIGPSDAEIQRMLDFIGHSSLDEMVRATVPEDILLGRPMEIPAPRGEFELIEHLRAKAAKNKVHRSCIGQGYYDTIVPPVIQRNILENPGWYTQYTPYQAEIAQGRLEALLNFQTMVTDLTGLEVANASLLDEGTAAAEALAMCSNIAGPNRTKVFVADDCHPQTIEVVRTRAWSMGLELEVGDPASFEPTAEHCGVLLQYPNTSGELLDHRAFIEKAHAAGALVVMATDLLALCMIKSPGELGADIAVGSAQRFGVPMGFGGPHAAFFATHEKHVRKMPGRIIGVSRDSQGAPALRMAIQTREQHIKRDKATSNICTAQALLAIMAGMYAVYHGPNGLRRIAQRTHSFAQAFRLGLERLGHDAGDKPLFDTLRVRLGTGDPKQVVIRANRRGINLRTYSDGTIGVAFDETADRALLKDLLECFHGDSPLGFEIDDLEHDIDTKIDPAFDRPVDYLTHEVFSTHDSETELLRYIFKLQGRDLSLAHSMIPLGSCTMKLNATSEMLPVTWPEFGRLHPFAPPDQTVGYREMLAELEQWLCEITGFPSVSLQPNAGSQGEYAGLVVIRAYHESRGEGHRNICLIPTSAHGTNPASAVIAGFEVVPVNCDETGAVDTDDLRVKAAKYEDRLGALMVTYPSTFGVFDQNIREIIDTVHKHGGQVYLDGANMNAQVGLCRPADYGADVCHLNLHKTFCIPHGGGGPGMGPIGAAEHLAPFLPGHPEVNPFGPSRQREQAGLTNARAGVSALGPVAAAPWGSPSILTISWVYIALMGAAGLKAASEIAILNANYMAKRLENDYEVLYRNAKGRVAHEFIIDCRSFDKSAGVKIDDIAKRLIDYGFHAPTMSWPVPGTLMIEPTESEPLPEMDRFCDALIAIREEIRAIEEGRADKADNLLRNSPHTVAMVSADDWSHPYSRREAAYPKPWLADAKFWPAVGRVDNPYGDRNLVCTCPPIEAYIEDKPVRPEPVGKGA